MDPQLLAAYASAVYGREITPDDPETFDLQEALDREFFRSGARAGNGYYLHAIIVPALPREDEDGRITYGWFPRLKSQNEVLRLDLRTEYRSFRNDWLKQLEKQIPFKDRPRAPLTDARVLIRIFTVAAKQKAFLDVEAKYAAVKVLLDCLTVPRVFSGSGKDVTQGGLSILADDTDGENGNAGVIRQLSVEQRRSKGFKIEITIEQVT